jgi:hypothetical protein
MKNERSGAGSGSKAKVVILIVTFCAGDCGGGLVKEEFPTFPQFPILRK